MSNEELAERIQAGETELVLQLWKQVEKLITKLAKQYSYIGGERCEVEDLIQSGFIAMMKAVQYYDPEAGFAFVTLLTYCTKNEFRKANGFPIRNKEALRYAVSLNTPLTDEWGADTLEDLQPDQRDQYEEIEQRIYLEQLREALSEALEKLPAEQREVIVARYYTGLTVRDTAERTNATVSETRKRELHGLKRIRRESKALEQFLDRNTNYYLHIGVDTFNTTHSSAVEKNVLIRERLTYKAKAHPDSVQPRRDVGAYPDAYSEQKEKENKK